MCCKYKDSENHTPCSLVQANAVLPPAEWWVIHWTGKLTTPVHWTLCQRPSHDCCRWSTCQKANNTKHTHSHDAVCRSQWRKQASKLLLFKQLLICYACPMIQLGRIGNESASGKLIHDLNHYGKWSYSRSGRWDTNITRWIITLLTKQHHHSLTSLVLTSHDISVCETRFPST